MDISHFIKKIVPITLFNKGKASQQFSRVNNGETLVVVKNNMPIAIIISPQEYELLQKIPNVYKREVDSGTIYRSCELDALVDNLKQFEGW